tara:strand:- start:259 stop:1194 length:936 start_codon:yes stop_codon:yes gene_type:complete
MNKLYLNAVFQLAVILVIIGLFLFDGLDIEKLKFIFMPKIILLFIYLVILKLFIAFLFFTVVNLVTTKKNYFNDIASTFLQGGIVNQLLPSAGFIFKYYKFKHIYGVSLAQYSFSQILLSLSSLLSYIILAIIFGSIIIINFNVEFFFYALLVLIFLIISIIFIENRFYLSIKNILLKIDRISNLINELIKIKNLILEKRKKLLYIFLGFLFLASLECLAFYSTIYLYEVEISFTKAIFLYVNTSLLTVVLLLNFIGLFEIILVISSALILSDYTDMIYVSLGYKVLNTFALIVAIIFLGLVSLFKKNNQL